MKHHRQKREFKKERTDRMDFRRKYVIEKTVIGRVIYYIRPLPFDDYDFIVYEKWEDEKKPFITARFDTYNDAIEYVLNCISNGHHEYVPHMERWF